MLAQKQLLKKQREAEAAKAEQEAKKAAKKLISDNKATLRSSFKNVLSQSRTKFIREVDALEWTYSCEPSKESQSELFKLAHRFGLINTHVWRKVDTVQNRTFLHKASEAGWGHLIKELLRGGGNPNLKDGNGNTPRNLLIQNLAKVEVLLNLAPLVTDDQALTEFKVCIAQYKKADARYDAFFNFGEVLTKHWKLRKSRLADRKVRELKQWQDNAQRLLRSRARTKSLSELDNKVKSPFDLFYTPELKEHYQKPLMQSLNPVNRRQLNEANFENAMAFISRLAAKERGYLQTAMTISKRMGKRSTVSLRQDTPAIDLLAALGNRRKARFIPGNDILPGSTDS